MLKQLALILLGLYFVIPAQAGLLEDDEARQQIQKLEAHVLKLDDALKQQQTKSMLDLQSQIDALLTEIRKLRGQNEEISHGLQDAEKRQKDFYVDLDTRVRHLESAEEAAREAAAAAAAAPPPAPAAIVPAAPVVPVDPSDPAPENRAFENAYGLFKSGNNVEAVKAFQDFIKKYPDSVHVPNANYWRGNAQFALKNYKAALSSYQELLKISPASPKAPEVMLGIANCQRSLKQTASAKKTLKQLITQYPDSESAAKAKKLLSAKK
jgi:tol-pal system protein YbgF